MCKSGFRSKSHKCRLDVSRVGRTTAAVAASQHFCIINDFAIAHLLSAPSEFMLVSRRYSSIFYLTVQFDSNHPAWSAFGSKWKTFSFRVTRLRSALVFWEDYFNQPTPWAAIQQSYISAGVWSCSRLKKRKKKKEGMLWRSSHHSGACQEEGALLP